MKKIHFMYLYLGFIGIIAALLMVWITPYGAGVNPDSIVYFGGAKSLLAGKGFSINGEPINHFPPLYPMFLAATGLFEANLVQAARFLDIILFGANLCLVALAVFLATRRSFFTTTVAVLFFLASDQLLETHSKALTEPLFITLYLACLILLSKYIAKPTLFLFIASSLSLGFAMVTRYMGIAFLPAALAIVFIGGSGQHFGRRFRNTLLWSMLACAPLGILLIRNMMSTGSAAHRSLIFHPMLSMFHYVKLVCGSLFDFFAPLGHLPVGVRPVICGLLVAFVIALLMAALFKRHVENINWRSFSIVMAVSCFLFSVAYLLFFFIAICFFDSGARPNARYLSPVFVTFIVGAFSSLWKVSQILEKRWVWLCLSLLAAVSISLKTPEAIAVSMLFRKNGSDYSSRQWQTSEIIAYIKRLENVKIYSNGADVYGFYTGKQCQWIPFKFSSLTAQANPRYDEEIDAMVKDITGNGALLVYFNRITWREELPTQTELKSMCSIPILKEFSDGTVYGGDIKEP